MEKILNNDRCKFLVCAILSVCVSLFLTIVICERYDIYTDTRTADTQKELAEEVLRFHVIANSDSEVDQSLKLLVRDGILSYMKENLPGKLSVDETEQWMESHKDEIICCAKEIISENGKSYDVEAELAETYFPEKRYGDLTFPKGYYRAFRVVIGNGVGRNWWCVLYPALCVTESSRLVVSEEGKEELEHVLTEKEYRLVTGTPDYRIKSFFFELFSKEKNERTEEIHD